MHHRKRLYQIGIYLTLFVTLMVASCSNDAVEPEVINIFKGTSGGTSFEVNPDEIVTVKNEDLIGISGIINSDVTFSIYARGENPTTYQVADTGIFIQTIDYIKDVTQILLDSLIANNGNADSISTSLIDTLNAQFDEIFADSSSILANNETFTFYFIGQNIYYSKAGFLDISKIDTQTLRMEGSFDFELNNIFDGKKQFSGTFEALEYSE